MTATLRPGRRIVKSTGGRRELQQQVRRLGRGKAANGGERGVKAAGSYRPRVRLLGKTAAD